MCAHERVSRCNTSGVMIRVGGGACCRRQFIEMDSGERMHLQDVSQARCAFWRGVWTPCHRRRNKTSVILGQVPLRGGRLSMSMARLVTAVSPWAVFWSLSELRTGGKQSSSERYSVGRGPGRAGAVIGRPRANQRSLVAAGHLSLPPLHPDRGPAFPHPRPLPPHRPFVSFAGCAWIFFRPLFLPSECVCAFATDSRPRPLLPRAFVVVPVP